MRAEPWCQPRRAARDPRDHEPVLRSRPQRIRTRRGAAHLLHQSRRSGRPRRHAAGARSQQWANRSSEWLLGLQGVTHGTSPDRLVALSATHARHRGSGTARQGDQPLDIRRASSPTASALAACSWSATPPTGIRRPAASASTPESRTYPTSAGSLRRCFTAMRPTRLLDTYEAERRPIAAFNVEHSLRNAGKHQAIAAAMGLRADQNEEDGWREIEIWASDTAEGERRRAATDAAVASNAEDYSQLNVEAGFAYSTGALIPDGTPAPIRPTESPIEFEPTARPGHHVPHVWLVRSGEPGLHCRPGVVGRLHPVR